MADKARQRSDLSPILNVLHDIKREATSLMNGSYASKMIYRDLMVTMAAKDNNFIFNHINIITLTYFSFGTKHFYIPMLRWLRTAIKISGLVSLLMDITAGK